MTLTVNEGLRAVAGTFIVISVALGILVSPWFFAFTAFVGLNLFQSAFSHWCPMMPILKKAGCRED
jgi:Inner membrane protein YgaP-like, transmembrane domain